MEKNKEIRKAQIAQKVLPEGLFAVIIAIALAVNVILYIVTEAFGLYLYQPTVDDLTLSGNTDVMFKEALDNESKVKIIFCQDEKDMSVHDTGSFVYRTAVEFENKYPEMIEIEYVNILTKRNQNGDIVDLSQYRKNKEEIFYSSVIFECEGRYKVLTDLLTSVGYSDFFTLNTRGQATAYNGEEIIASMISWVLTKEHKTAYVVGGHSEKLDASFTNLLVCSGYDVKPLDLKRENVPDDANLVIISNPASDFEKAAEGSNLWSEILWSEIDRLEDFVNKRNGHLIVTLDPYAKRLPVLEAFLSTYGISVSYTQSEKDGYIHNIVKDMQNAITSDGFTLVTSYADDPVANKIDDIVSKYSTGDVIIKSTGALDLSGEAKPILLTSSASSLEAGGKTVDTEGRYCVGAYSKSENRGTVFVVPSAYIAASDSLITEGYSNKEMLFALSETLFGAKNLPYGCKIVGYDTQTLENLTMGAATVYTVLFMSIPFAIAVVGTVIIIRRKNR